MTWSKWVESNFAFRVAPSAGEISASRHDHDIWHVGPLSDLEYHGPSRILIFGRVAPQAVAAISFLLSVKKNYFCLFEAAK